MGVRDSLWVVVAVSWLCLQAQVLHSQEDLVFKPEEKTIADNRGVRHRRSDFAGEFCQPSPGSVDARRRDELDCKFGVAELDANLSTHFELYAMMERYASRMASEMGRLLAILSDSSINSSASRIRDLAESVSDWMERSRTNFLSRRSESGTGGGRGREQLAEEELEMSDRSP